MLYIESKIDENTYNVMDTDDNSIETMSKLEILRLAKSYKIHGVQANKISIYNPYKVYQRYKLLNRVAQDTLDNIFGFNNKDLTIVENNNNLVLDFKHDKIGYGQRGRWVPGGWISKIPNIYDTSEKVIIPYGVTKYIRSWDRDLYIGLFSENNYIKSVEFPDTYLELEPYDFYYAKKLKNIKFSKNMKFIPKNCFGYCGFKSLIIPNNIVQLGNEAFIKCKKLIKIKLPDQLDFIGDSCFKDCLKLSSIEMPSKLDSIGESCFENCTNLERIQLPDSLYDISNCCFKNCNYLVSIKLPNNLKSIGDSCFLDCFRLSYIDLPDTVKSIGERCFGDCINITNIKLPDNIKVIKESTFHGCENLKDIKLPKKLKKIETKAFYNAHYLDYIYIPNKVTDIGDNCFERCFNLRKIRLPMTFKVNDIKSLIARIFEDLILEPNLLYKLSEIEFDDEIYDFKNNKWVKKR